MTERVPLKWTIAKAYTRTYRTTGRTLACIEWGDGVVTKGPADHPLIASLIERARREKKFIGAKQTNRAEARDG